MKYKKFFPVMQAALGIVPLNKRELLPPPRRLWKSHHLTLHSDNTRRPVPLLLLLSSFSPSLPHSESSTMRLGISGFITDILSTSSNICFCWADGKCVRKLAVWLGTSSGELLVRRWIDEGHRGLTNETYAATPVASSE
ncbi:hypothetical protein KOW79_004480 [Hemibagrus wyckioides]|uniref:Uncharacterized protein n=1 Tax=Hemibagrus wyckioides TaxID=337641 RepID=A0A9D3SPQ5_9TELE|nr:hypothetical protein KOW79_004480 [Hemibagrus wyckioides]